eukprot:COSAG05_NODE_500_length_9234_cov_107.281664_13_plen_34_part_00
MAREQLGARCVQDGLDGLTILLVQAKVLLKGAR